MRFLFILFFAVSSFGLTINYPNDTLVINRIKTFKNAIIQITDSTAFQSARTAIGSNIGTIQVLDTVIIKDKDSIPENITIDILGQGYFKAKTGSASDTIIIGKLGNAPLRQWIDTALTTVFTSGSVESVRPEWFGSEYKSINRAINSYNNIYLSDTLYLISGQIVLKSNIVLYGGGLNKTKIKEKDSFSLSSTGNCIVYGTNLTNVEIKNICFQGDATKYNDDGIDRNILKLRKSNNCKIINCKFINEEIGVNLYDSCYDCSINYCKATQCYYSAISSYGHTSGSLQNKRIDLSHNNVYGCKNDSATVAMPSGIRTEETYFSLIETNIVDSCGLGIRIENSCNNIIKGNISRENQGYGINLYNYSKRNIVEGNQCIDNNTLNLDSTAMTPTNTGNTGKQHSGIMLEYHAQNNVIAGNTCYNSTGGIGHQKYGIAINNRNFNDSASAECNNVVYGNVLINNEIDPISDRGFWNKVFNNIKILRDE